jgi:hypothetical protein
MKMNDSVTSRQKTTSRNPKPRVGSLARTRLPLLLTELQAELETLETTA